MSATESTKRMDEAELKAHFDETMESDGPDRERTLSSQYCICPYTS